MNNLFQKTTINNIKKIKPINYTIANEPTLNNNYSPKTQSAIDNRKIVNITIDPNKFLEPPKDPLSTTNNKWFLNLTQQSIPEDVSNLLQLGGEFCLPISQNKKEVVHEFIKDVESNIIQKKIKKETNIRNIVIPRLYKYLDSYTSKDSIDAHLISMSRSTSQFCKNNPNIMFTRADKGNVVVALDRESYIEKMETTLNDISTYNTAKNNPSLKLKRNLNNVLKKNWLQKDYIDKRKFHTLRASECPLPKAYGLPKIHKNNIPYRIIVSSIGTALYPIATFLHEIISESVPHSIGHVNNSFELYNSLTRKEIPESHILISLDVISLFTNVPIDLAVEGIRKRWSYIEKNTKIPIDEFISAIEFILSSTFFSFNNIIYKQTHGMPMGSPLSPIIADIVMQDLKSHAMNILKLDIPLYKRYADDIIMAAPRDRVMDILSIFNNFHSRLQFTVEYESNHCLNFLDIKLIRTNNFLTIDWYHKDTFSGRYLSYYSSHPQCHKIGTIYGLVDRAVLLSAPRFHQKNLEMVIQLLRDNGYPLELIFNKINLRFKKLVNTKLTHKKSNTQGDCKPDNSKKYITIPYIKNVSEIVTSVIDKNTFTIGYRCLNRLNRFVKAQKDKDTTTATNNVVYKIQCNDCDTSYVGQTKRKLNTRIKEQTNNIKLDSSKHSVISEHITQYKHSID